MYQLSTKKMAVTIERWPLALVFRLFLIPSKWPLLHYHILHYNHCCQFPLSITVVPRESKNNLYSTLLLYVWRAFFNKDKVTGSARVAKKVHSFNVTTNLQSSTTNREQLDSNWKNLNSPLSMVYQCKSYF